MTSFVKPPCDQGVVLNAPDTMPCSQKIGVWVLVATILGSSMAFIDGSVVNIVLPVLQKEFNATAGEVQWVVEAYALFLSALIIVGGALGDRYGRRRLFALGIAIFVLASIACGLSTSIFQLIIARAIQGIGGALLVPGSLAIISATFSDEQRGKAFGTWSGFTSVTSVVGPVLGGWLVQYVSWRWVFFLNVPFAAVVLFILFWRVPESRDGRNQGKLDLWGTLFITFGLGAIVYGLIEAGSLGLLHPLVIGSLLLGIVLVVAFVFVEAKVSAPMVPLTLFRSPTFSGTNLLTFLLYAALGAITFFLPFNLIQVQGYSPTAAGAAFVPFILTMFLLSRWTGGLVARFGAKLPLVVGPLITAAGFALFAVPGIGGSYWVTFFPAVLVMGIGMTITVAPLTTAVMGAVDQSHAGIASAINNAVSRAAGLLAIAVFGIVVLATFTSSLDQTLATKSVTPAVQQSVDAQRTKLAGIQLPATMNHEEKVVVQGAIDGAFISGFRVVALTCAGLAVVSAVCSGLLVEGKKKSRT